MGNTPDDVKEKILDNAKKNAIDSVMIKTASTTGSYQQPYASPFLNLSDMNIPERTVEIFRWCKYFYMFDPLISGAINSLATFPVTDIMLTDIDEYKNNDDESEWYSICKDVVLNKLKMHKFLIEIGIDYYLYGNCFVFGEFEDDPATNKRVWKSMIRLDPSKIIIDINPATNEKKYKLMVSERVKKIVKNKTPKETYNKLPNVLKEAALKNKAVVLKKSNIYHFERPSDSMGDNAWGIPIVANVLKLLMYRNILRQAQEAIAREHIVPFRVYYLQRTETIDPSKDWNKVSSDFAEKLKKAALDPNYKVVSPVPVGCINIGGQGRSLLLTPEIEQIQSEILAGMNIPREFIFGGVSYSGSAISLKILENQFITYRLLLQDFLQNFVIKGMAKENGEWEDSRDDKNLITVSLREMKMQDDSQQKSIIISLNAQGKVTDEYMWNSIGIDPTRMKTALSIEATEKIERDKGIQIKKLEADLEVQKKQLEIQIQLQQYQMQLQQQLQMPQTPINETPMADQYQIQQQGQEQIQQQGQEQIQQQGQEQLSEEDVSKICNYILNLNDNERNIELSKLPQNMRAQIEQRLSVMNNQQITNKSQMATQVQKSIEAQRIASRFISGGGSQEDLNNTLQNVEPDMAQMIMAYIQQYQDLNEDEDEYTGMEDNGVDMRPLPEQRPPRRESLQ